MKKVILMFMFMALCAGMIVVATPQSTEAAAVQTYLRKVRGRDGRIRYVRTAKPSYYRRHRNRVNVAAGTAGGAILGGLLGGGKGALIGAGVGAGSSALYTYKFNKKKRRYVKVRRY